MRNGKNGRNGRHCHHADTSVIASALYAVFIRRQLPGGLSIRDQRLLIGNLVLRAPSGNGERYGMEYVLSKRGEDVLMDLLEKEAIK